MWEISSLFENIGIVVDGMKILLMLIEVDDKIDVSIFNVDKGLISFENV